MGLQVLWPFIRDSGYEEDEHVLFHRGEALLEDIDCEDWVAPHCELADIYDGEPTSNLHFLFEHDDDALICLLIFRTRAGMISYAEQQCRDTALFFDESIVPYNKPGFETWGRSTSASEQINFRDFYEWIFAIQKRMWYDF